MSDTLRCPLDLAEWSFSAGCFRPALNDGEILILPLNTNASDPMPRPGLFDLFPDPSAGDLILRIPSRPGETVRITVVDMLGREVLQTHGVSASDQYQTLLDLAPRFPGTYYLHITCGTSCWVRSIRLY